MRQCQKREGPNLEITVGVEEEVRRLEVAVKDISRVESLESTKGLRWTSYKHRMWDRGSEACSNGERMDRSRVTWTIRKWEGEDRPGK